ncbi:MAG: adenylyl-sulfate kinase [Magnetococcales bacterium]|nr:adenylyl-sulfate kinase [Magnetococcales bacterium]MBF0260684.1 adenylyl-sulfate kinase [Magnetococcales bacterium]
MTQPNTSPNAVWQELSVTRADRERKNGHRGTIIWFTGLSGSGKSTMIHALEKRLHDAGRHTYALDGDNVRHGLCGDLGFSNQDRVENIRRIGEVAKLMLDAGLIVLCGFISPFAADRQRVRNLVAPGDFLEIHCECSLEICEQRDVKGLYRKARAGLIPEFTGISSPYEAPEHPELRLDTGNASVDVCVDRVLALLGGG